MGTTITSGYKVGVSATPMKESEIDRLVKAEWDNMEAYAAENKERYDREDEYERNYGTVIAIRERSREG